MSVHDLFADVAARAGIEKDTAAVYTRNVLETVAASLSPGQLERLSALLDQDVLALFETEERGELTTPEEVTEGAWRARGGDEGSPDR